MEFFTWELSPVLHQAIDSDNIFNTSSSPKYLFHSLRVIKIFRKGLNYVAMPALDWPEICFFKSFFFAEFVMCATLLHSAIARSSTSSKPMSGS